MLSTLFLQLCVVFKEGGQRWKSTSPSIKLPTLFLALTVLMKKVFLKCSASIGHLNVAE
jgi:non-canonical (house-cleaning) NTP pyrophosphatase